MKSTLNYGPGIDKMIKMRDGNNTTFMLPPVDPIVAAYPTLPFR